MLILCSFVSADWCYQETANESSICGGLSTGTYSCSGTWDDGNNKGCNLSYDGNWSSLGMASSGNEAYLYINYSKPANATNSSLWQIKEGDGGVSNNSIFSDCWNLTSLQFRLYSDNTGVDVNDFDCYNGSHWRNIARDLSNPQLYEEAMWWNITTSTSNTCTCAGLNTNWEIDLSNSCNLTSSCDLGTGELTFTGIGTFRCNETLEVADMGSLAVDQHIIVQDNCRIIIG